MRCTINSDRLDITKWEGKTQRLRTAIDKECYKRHLDDTLPFKLIMTMDQYTLLMRVKEFGDSTEWKYYKPEQRIYCSQYNCMEIIIKD